MFNFVQCGAARAGLRRGRGECAELAHLARGSSKNVIAQHAENSGRFLVWSVVGQNFLVWSVVGQNTILGRFPFSTRAQENWKCAHYVDYASHTPRRWHEQVDEEEAGTR